jgi:hypothetical protein
MNPCESACQLDLGDCKGREVPRLCELVAEEVPGYADLLRGLADPVVAARLRRAQKPRVSLGCGPCHGKPPGD